MPDFLLQPAKPLVIDNNTAMADAPPLEEAAVVAQKPQSMEDVQIVRSPTEDSEDDSPEMKQLGVPKTGTVEPSSPSLAVPNSPFTVIRRTVEEMLQAGKTVRLLLVPQTYGLLTE